MLDSSRLRLLGLALAVLASTSCGGDSAATITVYKSPSCGCCVKWVSHLREAGFQVTAVDVADLQRTKKRHGVPRQLASCHTALVDGYVVEGHVPAEDVARLLSERPEIAGLAVPDMPIGSPGMEGPNPESYVVYAFDEHGTVEHFASHGP